jgi:adenine-specific DNA-methyltransferase
MIVWLLCSRHRAPTQTPQPVRATGHYLGTFSAMTAPKLESVRSDARKARGAFFTPPAIADYLAWWAVGRNRDATILDPTCGEAVFLLAAARELRKHGTTSADLGKQVIGVDIHKRSLAEAKTLLKAEGLDARLLQRDFFDLVAPNRLGCEIPEVDAVIGNPPFVRYQVHAGESRQRSASAALAQGVRLSGLASSWAALLVHACGFLKPDGRLAMVLPAELLTVHYAEPIRRWLRQRFGVVHLVLFERLQFAEALEQVVLVVAQGSGGCPALSLHPVREASELPELSPFDHIDVTPAEEGKWTDLLLPASHRRLFKRVTGESFVSLSDYGAPELGAVTGANAYFTLTEEARREYGIGDKHVVQISPPGTRHLRGLSFTASDWAKLRDANEPVWLLRPGRGRPSAGLGRYLAKGEELGVHEAYKCRIRDPWWRPPLVPTPDLFFTYMSHRYPRLIANDAHMAFLNSMHGLRLGDDAPTIAKHALPLLSINSITMLGAELFGRSYGGGVLKMEPREAAGLPVPSFQLLRDAWATIEHEFEELDTQLRDGLWRTVAERIDSLLLRDLLDMSPTQVEEIQAAALLLRERRLGQTGKPPTAT